MTIMKAADIDTRIPATPYWYKVVLVNTLTNKEYLMAKELTPDELKIGYPFILQDVTIQKHSGHGMFVHLWGGQEHHFPQEEVPFIELEVKATPGPSSN